VVLEMEKCRNWNSYELIKKEKGFINSFGIFRLAGLYRNKTKLSVFQTSPLKIETLFYFFRKVRYKLIVLAWKRGELD
jgi:hypothetical protein